MDKPKAVEVQGIIASQINTMKMDHVPTDIDEYGFDMLDSKYVYSFGLPDNIHGETINKVVILINEISQQPNIYGSDLPSEELATIQVQFFYPTMFSLSYYDDIEKPIMNALIQDGWRRTLGGGHDRDPDTKQIYTTYHIIKSVNYW